MSFTSASVTPSMETTTSMLGRVKWFNNKAGYGFITVTDGIKSGSDIFVHHSAIVVSTQQYKYLVQGEDVQFILSDNAGGVHQFVATNVTGVKGGSLMCETRHESKNTRVSDKSGDSNAPRTPRLSSSDGTRKPMYNKSNVVRARGGGPRDGQRQRDGQKDWCLVKNDMKEKVM